MKKLLLLSCIVLLIIFESLRVYLIMPMPGSQQFDAIDLAYFLGINKWAIRLIGYALVFILGILVFRKVTKKDKIIASILVAIYISVFYVFTFQMEADKMFYQPSKVITSSLSINKIPTQKLVIGVVVDSIAKAYPIQLIGYHHQVVDTINGKPIMVTYCTVCRTGRVYSPIVNGKQEIFRLVGMDHFNAMFEDATTKSWWRQSNGECIAGPLKGYRLTELKSEQLTLAVWSRKYPNTLVLQADSAFKEKFEKMDTYDKGKSKGALTKRDTTSWSFKSWVLGVELGNKSKMYDWNLLTKQRLIEDSIGQNQILILLENDTSSFHTYNRVVGGQVLRFQKNSDSIIDLNTGSFWNFDGVCINGKLKDSVLQQVNSYQEFLHSWEFFHPKSERYMLK
jgi:hypothetical protein